MPHLAAPPLVTPEPPALPEQVPAVPNAPAVPVTVDPPSGFWEVALAPGTLVPALISICAAGIAAWQAWVARAARNATISQATTARETLEDDRAERYARAAPTFEVTIDPQTQTRPAGARIRMLTGPRRVRVTIEWRVRFTWHTPGEVQPHERLTETEHSGVYSASLCKGATLVAFSEERDGATLFRALAEYKIKSVDEDDETRTWRDEQMTGWALDLIDPTATPASL